jgi:hypothetical protein
MSSPAAKPGASKNRLEVVFPGPSGGPPGPSVRPPGPSVRPPGASVRPPGASVRPPGASVRPPRASVRPPGASVRPPGASVRPPGASVRPPGTSVRPPGTSVRPPGRACQNFCVSSDPLIGVSVRLVCVRPMTAAAFGRALAVGKQDRISCGWSGQWRSRIGSLLMTNAPRLIWINPKPIKKGESRLSLFDLCGSIPNMPATKPLLPRSKRTQPRGDGNSPASKPPIRLFNPNLGRTRASNQCSVGAAWLHWLKV